jgi:hypothetical protein
MVIALAWQEPSRLYAHWRTAHDATPGISMMNFIVTSGESKAALGVPDTVPLGRPPNRATAAALAA